MKRREFMVLASGLLVPWKPQRAYSFLWAPQSFGGLGGITGGRAFDPTDLFEAAIKRRFGAQLIAEGSGNPTEGSFLGKLGIGAEIWSALANTQWEHVAGHDAGYSFRAAGDLIAAVRGAGDYMDWYCSGDYETVSERVRDGLAIEGWRQVPFGD